MKNKSAWLKYNNKDIQNLEKYSNDYMAFISNCKTERECAKFAINAASKNGYKTLEEVIKIEKSLSPGDKVMAQIHGKSVMLIHVGQQPLEKGMNIIGAHIDSPRLDIKQNPLYESSDICFMDTHYYGGIKNYQWVAIPLALHGVVVKKDGKVVDINIGEDSADPVFCISDLLPHLGTEQMAKTANKVIEGEDLDLIFGNRPNKSKENAVKANLLSLLNKKYKIQEEDFLSAELEVVPAGAARTMGLDESMILGYGHDDRVCSFAAIHAQFALPKIPNKTAVCLLVDKEEIGSVGATGMTSKFFENTIAEIIALGCSSASSTSANTGSKKADKACSSIILRRCLAASNMLSADVNAAFDPTYASVYEAKNSCYLGRGLVFTKFTGSRGKAMSNDASAEFMAQLRNIMEEANVSFQTSELGRVNAGGGGTIAFILAEYTMNVIDAGVGVLSMHAPWEVCSKADIFEMAKGFKAFYENA